MLSAALLIGCDGRLGHKQRHALSQESYKLAIVLQAPTQSIPPSLTPRELCLLQGQMVAFRTVSASFSYKSCLGFWPLLQIAWSTNLLHPIMFLS